MMLAHNTYSTNLTITLRQVSSGSYTPTGYAIINPVSFYNGQNDTFYITFISPFANFVNYSFSIEFPNGTVYNFGTYRTGQNFSIPFVIPSGTTPYNIILNYTWFLDDNTTYTSGFNTWSVPAYTNKTLINMGSQRYGLYVGDRVVWLTVALILLMGAAYLGAGISVSLGVGGIFIWIFIRNGFLGVGSAFFTIPLVIIVGYLILKGWYVSR